MIRKKLMASMAAIALGVALNSTLDAATMLPDGAHMPMPGDKGIIAKLSTATESFFDYFEEGHARKEAFHSLAERKAFHGPYTLMVSGSDSTNSLGMVLASLGLMAMIVHRRRNI